MPPEIVTLPIANDPMLLAITVNVSKKLLSNYKEDLTNRQLISILQSKRKEF